MAGQFSKHQPPLPYFSTHPSHCTCHTCTINTSTCSCLNPRDCHFLEDRYPSFRPHFISWPRLVRSKHLRKEGKVESKGGRDEMIDFRNTPQVQSPSPFFRARRDHSCLPPISSGLLNSLALLLALPICLLFLPPHIYCFMKHFYSVTSTLLSATVDTDIPQMDFQSIGWGLGWKLYSQPSYF